MNSDRYSALLTPGVSVTAIAIRTAASAESASVRTSSVVQPSCSRAYFHAESRVGAGWVIGGGAEACGSIWLTALIASSVPPSHDFRDFRQLFFGLIGSPDLHSIGDVRYQHSRARAPAGGRRPRGRLSVAVLGGRGALRSSCARPSARRRGDDRADPATAGRGRPGGGRHGARGGRRRRLPGRPRGLRPAGVRADPGGVPARGGGAGRADRPLQRREAVAAARAAVGLARPGRPRRRRGRGDRPLRGGRAARTWSSRRASSPGW